VIRVERVGKRFGATAALRNVSFSVARGELVGFVGPNGAGKTTMLRIIAGFLDADTGRVQVDGLDVARERGAACARIGYLPENAPLYQDMRVDEYLRFRARVKGVRRAQRESSVDAVISQVGIGEHRRRLIGRLSKGYRQRVGIADALVARPPILVLDEPTAGLDPIQVKSFRDLLGELLVDHTILLSSHLLAEVGAVASRVVVLAAGRVVADGTIDDLRAEVGKPADASLEEVFVALAEGAEHEGEEA
jgi:ABC-2 type transport system ATP-binding protein